MNHRGFRRMNLHHIRSLYFSHFLCNIFLLNRLVNGHNYVQHASIMQSILLWTLSIIQWNTLDYYHDTVISNTSRFQKNVKWKLRSGYRCLLNHSLCSWWCWWSSQLFFHPGWSMVEHTGWNLMLGSVSLTAEKKPPVSLSLNPIFKLYFC